MPSRSTDHLSGAPSVGRLTSSAKLLARGKIHRTYIVVVKSTIVGLKFIGPWPVLLQLNGFGFLDEGRFSAADSWMWFYQAVSLDFRDNYECVFPNVRLNSFGNESSNEQLASFGGSNEGTKERGEAGKCCDFRGSSTPTNT